ncbi:MAG: septation ring formation regulator EzrA, partial [Acidobacteriia bacterium]|nr:septation ring formation regulator EzrA [Terriglobia bacterium]
MKTKLARAAILAGMLFVVACNSAKKTTADSAIKAAQTAYADIADQANRYVPDQAKDVQAAIQTAQDAFNKGDYSEAFEASRTLPVKVKGLKTAAAARKDELTAQWNELSNSMPGMVSAVQTKVDALTKKRKLPKGVADSLASAKQTWTEVADIVDTVNRAIQIVAVRPEFRGILIRYVHEGLTEGYFDP